MSFADDRETPSKKRMQAKINSLKRKLAKKKAEATKYRNKFQSAKFLIHAAVRAITQEDMDAITKRYEALYEIKS